MLKVGDIVRYVGDGMKGRVQKVTEHHVMIRCTNGEEGYLDPLDAAQALEVWRGDKRRGAFVALDAK